MQKRGLTFVTRFKFSRCYSIFEMIVFKILWDSKALKCFCKSQEIVSVIIFNKQPCQSHLTILFIICVQKKAGSIENFQNIFTIYATSVGNMNFKLKGCVRYIFASLLLKSRREHQSNQENFYIFKLQKLFSKHFLDKIKFLEFQIFILYITSSNA